MDSAAQWDDVSARSFYLEQLKLVRAEADKLADESRVTERYVLGACGAIYTFVLAQWSYVKSWQYLLILIIPLVLAIWGGIRSRALYLRILQWAEFLRNAECALRVSEWTGWEHWLTDPKRDEHVLANSAKTIWSSLIIGTTLIALAAFVGRFLSHH